MTESNDNDSNAGTIIALFAIGLCCAGLIGISALVMPQILGFVVVVAGFVLLGILHYVTWGRWLSKSIQSEPDEDED